jgi:hypothetical protein
MGTSNCGGCTLCCELFPVEWLAKPPNTHCAYECEAGCAIHDTKLAECSDFECAWLQSGAPDALRPDRCGIVFEKLSDRLFYGTVARRTDDGLWQARSFVEQGYSVVLAGPQMRPQLLAAEGHDETTIRAEFDRHIEERWLPTAPT